MSSLKGQAILVTGGSSGIGAGIARRLGAEGVKVGVGYYGGQDRAEDVAREVREAGGEAIVVPGNVSDEDETAQAVDRMTDAFGRLDGIVVNAGVQADAPIGEMTFDQWQKVIGVDLDGAFLCTREAIRAFRAQDWNGKKRGAIVYVSSVHQFIPWAGHVNYAAAKGGVEMLMRSTAQEVAREGIRVNAVAPGAITTPINKDVWSDEKKREELLKLIPYGRLGEEVDCANAVAWLLSDESDYVIGTTLTIDGGMSLYPSFIGNG